MNRAVWPACGSRHAWRVGRILRNITAPILIQGAPKFLFLPFITVENKKCTPRFAWCLIHVYATEVYLWPLPESTMATLSDAILSSDPVL